MGEEKIRDILSRLELTPKPSLETEVKEREASSIWLERNIEKYPIYFTGSEKTKKEREKKLSETRNDFVVAKRETENGRQALILQPSIKYGLMGGDEANVVNAVQGYLQEEIRFKLGYYPKNFFVPIKELCKRMYLTKTGPNYKNIVKSLRTIDSCAIIHNRFFKTRTSKGAEDMDEKEKILHIFRVVEVHKRDRKIHRELKNKEYVVEIELEDWMRRNLENYYATKIDKEIYFLRLDSPRSRRLHTYLSAYNYKKEAEIKTQEIIELLWIMDEETSNRKVSITRAIDPLVEAGFLERYEFSWDEIKFVFSKVRARKVIIYPEDKARVDSITLKILEALGDIHSERFYKLIARKVPEDVIFLCLSGVKEMGRQGQIKRSRGAAFVEMIASECKKRGIKVPFRQRKTIVSLR